jgi:hypothetical protein
MRPSWHTRYRSMRASTASVQESALVTANLCREHGIRPLYSEGLATPANLPPRPQSREQTRKERGGSDRSSGDMRRLGTSHVRPVCTGWLSHFCRRHGWNNAIDPLHDAADISTLHFVGLRSRPSAEIVSCEPPQPLLQTRKHPP